MNSSNDKTIKREPNVKKEDSDEEVPDVQAAPPDSNPSDAANQANVKKEDSDESMRDTANEQTISSENPSAANTETGDQSDVKNEDSDEEAPPSQENSGNQYESNTGQIARPVDVDLTGDDEGSNEDLAAVHRVMNAQQLFHDAAPGTTGRSGEGETASRGQAGQSDQGVIDLTEDDDNATVAGDSRENPVDLMSPEPTSTPPSQVAQGEVGGTGEERRGVALGNHPAQPSSRDGEQRVRITTRGVALRFDLDSNFKDNTNANGAQDSRFERRPLTEERLNELSAMWGLSRSSRDAEPSTHVQQQQPASRGDDIRVPGFSIHTQQQQPPTRGGGPPGGRDHQDTVQPPAPAPTSFNQPGASMGVEKRRRGLGESLFSEQRSRQRSQRSRGGGIGASELRRPDPPNFRRGEAERTEPPRGQNTFGTGLSNSRPEAVVPRLTKAEIRRGQTAPTPLPGIEHRNGFWREKPLDRGSRPNNAPTINAPTNDPPTNDPPTINPPTINPPTNNRTTNITTERQATFPGLGERSHRVPQQNPSLHPAPTSSAPSGTPYPTDPRPLPSFDSSDYFFPSGGISGAMDGGSQGNDAFSFSPQRRNTFSGRGRSDVGPQRRGMVDRGTQTSPEDGPASAPPAQLDLQRALLPAMPQIGARARRSSSPLRRSPPTQFSRIIDSRHHMSTSMADQSDMTNNPVGEGSPMHGIEGNVSLPPLRSLDLLPPIPPFPIPPRSSATSRTAQHQTQQGRTSDRHSRDATAGVVVEPAVQTGESAAPRGEKGKGKERARDDGGDGKDGKGED